MIELVFTACLLAAPERCGERRLTFTDAPSPMACMMNSQVELAKWSAAYPKWQVKRWKCQLVDFASTDA